MRLFGLTAAALLALLGAVPALSHGGDPYGEPGDPKAPSRTVTVAMVEKDDGHMAYLPNAIEVKIGEQIRFVLQNRGQLDHEFVLGTEGEIDEHAKLMQKFPEMEHADPNMKRVPPGAEGELVWRFTVAGEFDFACLIPGHIKSGMFGSITVK